MKLTLVGWGREVNRHEISGSKEGRRYASPPRGSVNFAVDCHSLALTGNYGGHFSLDRDDCEYVTAEYLKKSNVYDSLRLALSATDKAASVPDEKQPLSFEDKAALRQCLYLLRGIKRSLKQKLEAEAEADAA